MWAPQPIVIDEETLNSCFQEIQLKSTLGHREMRTFTEFKKIMWLPHQTMLGPQVAQWPLLLREHQVSRKNT